MAFKTMGFLMRHEKFSDLHQKNVQPSPSELVKAVVREKVHEVAR
jgi:hypothetical protein